jgi:predicted neuraminidase
MNEPVTLYEVRSGPGICHCASIVENAEGELLCVWYEGPYETSPDTVLKISRKSARDSLWSEAEILFRFSGVPLGNPVLFSFGDGILYLIYSILFGESWKESVLYISESRDQGRAWTQPALLYPKRGLMGKTKPILLTTGGTGGRVLVPLYNQIDFYPLVLVAERRDWWASSGIVAETMARGKAIQPALAELPDGKIVMFTRTNQGRIWKSVSYNGGLSWSICKATLLPNPNSAIDLLHTAGSRLLLAYNNSATNRYSLSIALSEDSGDSWTAVRNVCRGEGEYSYPFMIAGGNGGIHLVYTENRYRIKYMEFTQDWVLENRLEVPLTTEEETYHISENDKEEKKS